MSNACFVLRVRIILYLACLCPLFQTVLNPDPVFLTTYLNWLVSEVIEVSLTVILAYSFVSNVVMIGDKEEGTGVAPCDVML